jgi:hypothetical protein
MNTSAASNTPGSAPSEPAPFRDLLSDAISYWEPRRVGYNAFLALVVLGWVAFSWPHFRSAFTWQSLLLVFVLAVLANVCYCAAYVADIPMQYSAFRETWRRRRWALWCVGVLFAGAITFYWIADEIYPFVK